MATHSGPLATICCEPRQTRKGAAVTVDPGAGVWLGQVTANTTHHIRHALTYEDVYPR